MARNTQSSLYKVLDNVDLSRNTLFNVSKIVGNQYEDLDKDLEISSWDNASSESAAGNLILRSGVNEASGDSGSVRLFSGTRDDDARGITLDPDTSITIKAPDSSTGDISLEANHDLSLKALENEVTLSQTTEDNVTYNTLTVNNSGTNKGKIDVTSDIVNITSNSDLDINIDSGVYRVVVEEGASTETVDTLNVDVKANIDGIFDYDGTTFNVDATTKTTVNSKELEINAGYASSSSDATLVVTATSEDSSITVNDIIVKDVLDSENITARNVTASTSFKSNTSLEAQGTSTLKGIVSIEDTDSSTPGSLSVSSKTINLNNSSTTESIITIDSKSLTLDADNLTVSSNNKNLLTATSSTSTLSVDNVNATTQVNIGSEKLLINLDGNNGVISANTKLVEKSKLLHLFSGYNSEEGGHALDLEVKLENNSYVSSLSIDSIESGSIDSTSLTSETITAETKLTSDTELLSKGTSTLEGTVNIQNTSNTTTGELNVTSKEVSIDNHSTSESSVAINTVTLDVDATTKTEDVTSNSTTTVTGTLSETAGTLNLTGTSALSITANNKNLITADTSSSTATIDNITASTQLDVTSGTVNVGNSSNASTVTAAKSLDIVTPDLDITAGGNTILSGTSSSSALNVTTTTATTTIANDIQATESLLVGSSSNGLLIYWDSTSSSVVFARKG